MLLHLWKFRWLCLYFILKQYATADWPSSNVSNVQLLGLFLDSSNTSEQITSAIHSRAMFKAAVLLSQQYNIKIGGQLIGWQSVQTGGDAMGALRSSCLVVSASNIVGIVGPALSSESHVIVPYAEKIGIPVISYASTDPDLSDRKVYPSFYRTVPSDDAAALAIAQLFMQFNWTSCIIIYQNDAFGSGGAKAINEAFKINNLTVNEMIVFDISTLTFQKDLRSVLMNSASRIVLVWAETAQMPFILQGALDNDVIGPQFTWILSSTVPLNIFNQSSYNKLTGILTIEPVVGNVVNASINITLLNAAYDIWQEYEPATFPESDDVDYYALFAFDAAWTLIQALQKFCSTMNNNSPSCISFTNTSFCFDRQLLNSSSLFNAINSNSFLGVTGSVQFSPNVTDRINGTYYIAKNVQSSSSGLNYVPVSYWSESGGWTSHTQTSIIIWPGNSLVRPSGYASVSGVTLQIAVGGSAPFTISRQITDAFGNTTTNITGYMPELIELLRNRMGFIPNITVISSNQSYNALVDAVAKGVYDMVIADMTVTAARRQKVAFSSSIFDNSLRIILREAPIVNIDLLSYLSPFSLLLWITLLIAIIYAGCLMFLLERHDNEALKDRSIPSQIGLSTWYSVGTIFGFGVDFDASTAAGRLLTVGLYILSLILVAAYTANLASDLTISKSKGIISGVEDIKNGKIPFSRIGILTDSSVEDYYLREISSNSRNFYPLKSEDEIYDKLLNNVIDASIMDAGVVEYSTNNIYCNLSLVGTDFDKSAYGVIFAKNWPYQQELDVKILSLRESGALDDLKSKWFQTTYCSKLSEVPTAMTIESMAGLFLTFAVISILAVLFIGWTKRSVIKNYFSRKFFNKENNVRLKKSSEVSSEHTSPPNIPSSPTIISMNM